VSDVCEVCDGEGILIQDGEDQRGNRVDEVIDCPACTVDDFRELDEEPEDLGPLEHWWPTG